MDGEMMKIVTEELRSLAEKDLKRQSAMLSSEAEALNAVRFLLHCKVKRVYVTVEKISDDLGRMEPVPLMKAELRYKNPFGGSPGQRTIIWGKDPLLEQIFDSLPGRGMEWDRSWSGPLSNAILKRSPELRKHVSKVEKEIEKHMRVLQRDEKVVTEVKVAVQRIYGEERRQQESRLRENFKILSHSGWGEEDVLKIWREEQVRVVQDS